MTKCYYGLTRKQYYALTISEQIELDDKDSQKAEAETAKEMGYKERPYPKKTCDNCQHSEVTNAGAVYPGLRCVLMEKRAKKKLARRNNDVCIQVREDAVCKDHKMMPQ
jgi:hypothetical protein